MHHEKEDPGHDIDREIPPDSRAAQSEDREHHIKNTNEHDRLKDVQANRSKGIVVLFAHLAHDRMIDELRHGNGSANTASRHSFGLKHANQPLCAS